MPLPHFVRRFWLPIAIVVLLALAAVVPSPSTSIAAFLFEVVSRCPDVSRPIPSSEFFVIGHRGAAGRAVENTLPSMDAAMRLGANALEIDLCMTRDSAIVLWHDWDPEDPISLARQKGAEEDVMYRPLVPEDEHPSRRPVHELTLTEMRATHGYSRVDSVNPVVAHIPTLEEFLAWSRGVAGLRAVYLDIKVPAELAPMAPAMVRRIELALATAPNAYEVIYLVAVDTVFATIEPMLPRGNIAFDAEPPSGLILQPCDEGSVEDALKRGNHHASIIIPVTSTLAPWTTARRIVQCDVARAGSRVRVVTGTLNDPERLECLVRIGVHGAFTDFPERLRAVVDGHGGVATTSPR